MEPEVYILKNPELEVHITNLGATLMRMITPNKSGYPTDILLGMEQAADYNTPEYIAGGAYLGACIGRYGNRIAGGKFSIDGREYQLAINNGPNHLHGGLCGFDRKWWTAVEQGDTFVTLQYVSPDGEEHYPGNLTVRVRFSVEDKELKIDYRAETDRKCYVNLTHHPYFNLNPEAADVRKLQLKLFSQKYLKSRDLIPEGTFVEAEGDYNFADFKPLAAVIENCGGLDDCFVFDPQGKVERQAELFSPESGIKLYVCSDYPGLQVYTGRFLDVKNAKDGKAYGAYAGVALEAQYWPDSPNHVSFPTTLLKPGEVYQKTTIYGVE